jgi:hypothetical protein
MFADSEHAPRRRLARHARKLVPRMLVRWIRRVRGGPPLPLGLVRFGDLKRLSPISRDWGLDRGMPVDRYFIESFVARNAGDVRRRVLEVAENTYTRRFGGDRVTHSDILSVQATPKATIVGDIAKPIRCRRQRLTASFSLRRCNTCTIRARQSRCSTAR